jgi:predicted RNA-binding protein
LKSGCFGGVNIKQQKLVENEEKIKFWIHKIEEKSVGVIHDKKILGSRSPRAKIIRNVGSGDKILFFTTLFVGRVRKISFVGYGLVDTTFDADKNYLGYDGSRRKIKLKGLKFLMEPVPQNSLSDELDFIKNKRRSSDYFSSEFREIFESDFKKVIDKRRASVEIPDYFGVISFTTDEFLLDSIRGLFDLLRVIEDSKLIEIKEFVKLLHKMVGYYDISKSFLDVERFYSENVWKLNFEHSPSRDPDKFVVLYDSRGNPHSFGYIRLR